MSKLVISVFVILIMVALVLSIIFAGIAIGKSDQLTCQAEPQAQNLKDNMVVSVVLNAIAFLVLILLIGYVIIWNYRRNAITGARLEKTYSGARSRSTMSPMEGSGRSGFSFQ